MKFRLLSLVLLICLLAAGCASGETDSSSTVSHESKVESTPDSSETQSTSDPNVSDVSDVSDPDEKPLWDTTPKNIEYTATAIGVSSKTYATVSQYATPTSYKKSPRCMLTIPKASPNIFRNSTMISSGKKLSLRSMPPRRAEATN